MSHLAALCFVYVCVWGGGVVGGLSLRYLCKSEQGMVAKQEPVVQQQPVLFKPSTSNIPKFPNSKLYIWLK